MVPRSSGPSRAIVLVAALLLACPAAASAQRLPEIDGMTAWDEPIARAPRAVRDVLAEATRVARDRPSPPRGRSLAAATRYARETLPGWIARRLDAIAAVDRALAPFAGASPRERVLGAIVSARLREETVAAIEAAPRADEIARDPELSRAYDDTMRRALEPMLRQAIEAYSFCARSGEGVPEPMRPTVAACARRAAALEARLAPVAPPSASAAPPPRGRVIGADRVPAACSIGIAEGRAPEIPVPPEGTPLEIAVVYQGSAVEGRAGERVAAAVQRSLARDRSLRLVPRADVRRAQQLAAERRWRRGGPACGQAPSLASVLAIDHPNLAIARVDDVCSIGAGPDGGCFLEIRFARVPGSAGGELPDDVRGRMPDRATGVAGWIAAARTLEAMPIAGVLGALPRSPEEPLFRIASVADDDPALRIPETLRAREGALRRCFGGRGTARFEVAIAIDASGATTRAHVTPDPATVLGEPADVEAVRACVERVVASASWPCPRDGAAAVDLTLCVGE